VGLLKNDPFLQELKTMDIIEQKKALRTKIKQMVEELTKDYIEYSNKKICDAVIALPEFNSAKVIFCFVGRNIEIGTLPIIERALKEGKTVGVPRCVGKRVMDVHEFTSIDDLELSNFGILEPKAEAKIIKPEEIDFSLVPCMTVNESGHRLGYGGGFYDTYLEKSNSFSCLVCRSKIMWPDIPLEVHDKMPDVVVTEDKVIRLGV
jgi:5-formyltetrahydrofolate cyclo-ligase